VDRFGKIHGMTSSLNLDQVHRTTARTRCAIAVEGRHHGPKKIHRYETIIEQLSHEIAILKRHKFARRSEQISPAQGSLLDDLLNTDLEAIEAELNALRPAPTSDETRQKPKRAPLPPQFPRTIIRHEPANTRCVCGCQFQRIGEDVSEKLDYTPGVFTVKQHVRGKWACRQCETLIQAPVPAQVIDKGISTAGLLAHVLVANSLIICRCTDKKRSLAVQAWRSRVQRWLCGWAKLAYSSNRWWMHCARRCWLSESCMPMKRRCRCWRPERR